jgi:CBS domain-containing protein
MKVQDLMTSHVRTCTPDTNLAEAAVIMFENDCGSLPVVDESGKLVGMVTDRDICIAAGTNHQPANQLRVADLALGTSYFCRPEQDIAVALEAMSKGRVRRLPVVSSDGTVEGILSVNDIVLQTSEASRGGQGLNSTDVLRTLKAICEHRDQVQLRDEAPPQAAARA